MDYHKKVTQYQNNYSMQVIEEYIKEFNQETTRRIKKGQNNLIGHACISGFLPRRKGDPTYQTSEARKKKKLNSCFLINDETTLVSSRLDILNT